MSGSDERDDDGPEPGRAGSDASAAAPATTGPKAPRSPQDEDALDLDDLDAVGVDGVLAQMREQQRGGADEVPIEPPPRRRFGARSPMLSLVVIAAGMWMLFGLLWADFRYWMRSSEPRDLGTAAEIVVDGRMPEGLHDTYVEIRGTPDVQHALRGASKESYVGYLRVIEAGGSLFAAVRRPKDEPIRDEFEGRFVGRMTRMSRVGGGVGTWIERYFADEGVVRTIDVEPAALWQVLGRGAAPFELPTEGGKIRVVPNERVRVVVHPPDARVQLGVRSFPDADKAQAAIEALGYPWLAIGKSDAFHSFLVRIPEAERTRVQQRLTAGLALAEPITDPKLGAVVLPGTVAFSARAGDYVVDADAVSLPRETEGGPVLHDVAGDKLMPRADRDGRIAIPRDWVHAVRVEEPIVVDRENGYMIVVGEQPSDHRLGAGLWLLVAVLVGINVASLVQHLRRRAAAAEA